MNLKIAPLKNVSRDWIGQTSIRKSEMDYGGSLSPACRAEIG
jgi:hypothetical protein